MKVLISLALVVTCLRWACAHGGGHEHTEEGDVENPKDYIGKHMRAEHHIDGFDLKSFFTLHDLNSDGFLDREEIEAIYGVHHEYTVRKTPKEKLEADVAKRIVDEVLAKIDLDKDGKISVEEFEKAGIEGLPDFTELGAEGHHYDVESEFFLHHEEVHHGTEETQTDESYNHPEDIAHFAAHEKIELDETNKERRFQGLDPLTELPASDHDHPEPPAAEAETETEDTPEERVVGAKFTRPEQPTDPKVKFREAVKEAGRRDEWGQGDDGYKKPRTPADKLRRNVPYKYKFKRSWGDF